MRVPYVGRARMPKLVDFKLIPLTLWFVIATTWVVTQGIASVWGWSRGIAVGMLFLIIAFAPRQARINYFTSAAFYLAEEAIKADNWEAQRGNRWRARLQKVGFERDFSFWGQQTTAARKAKWVRLHLRPKLSLWPKPWHVVAVTVRIPPKRRLNSILDDLTEGMAEFFNVPPSQLKVEARRVWMKTTVTFTKLKANGGRERPRDYIEVLDRGR